MIGVKQVILTGLISVLSYGQTIHVSGTYLDQKTNPIPEARVRYLLDTTPVDSTTTDMEGHFVLHLDFTGLVTETTPHDFTLSQNYPNPFNPTTQFTVATPTKGQVVIYNILGQLVDRLTLPEAGAYTITWGGANRRGELVPAGVYLYALQTATQRQVHKMVLLDGGDGRRLHIDQQVASRNMNGLARPADPVSQIEFIKDNTTPRTLTIPTPDADTELDIIIGNVGPQVLEDPPLVNLDLNDTLYLNLNTYIISDNSPGGVDDVLAIVQKQFFCRVKNMKRYL